MENKSTKQEEEARTSSWSSNLFCGIKTSTSNGNFRHHDVAFVRSRVSYARPSSTVSSTSIICPHKNRIHHLYGIIPARRSKLLCHTSRSYRI
jgi:hypothetical protein